MFRIFISHSYLATFILPSTTRPTSRPCNLNLHKPHLFYGPQTGKSYRTATKYVIYLRKVQSANEIWNFSSLLEPFKLSNPSATGAAPELRWDSGGEERDLSEGQIGRNQYFTWLGSSTMSQVTTFQSYQNTQDKARPAAEGAGPGGEVCQVPGLDHLASIY